MTRMQEMSLDYHFTVEQEVGSATYAFFGFNGIYRNMITISRSHHPDRGSVSPKRKLHPEFCNNGAGTAGVWRIAALNEAGGWKDRTTVEDMDLAVRASLKGWKFVYVGDLKVLLRTRTCTLFSHVKVLGFKGYRNDCRMSDHELKTKYLLSQATAFS